MKQRILSFALCLLFGATMLAAQEGPGQPRPAWAEGLPGWGVMLVATRPPKTALERLEWKREFLVGQDAKDNIYVFDAAAGRLLEFGPGGDQRGDTVIPNWKAMQAETLAGFAVDGRGDTFAYSQRAQVVRFHRRGVAARVGVPTWVTGLAWRGGELVAARLPVVFSRSQDRKLSIARAKELVSPLHEKGSFGGSLVEADDAEGPSPMAIALTQRVLVAADRGGALWVVDQFRLYRVRRFSPYGGGVQEWTDAEIKAPVSFTQEGEKPKELAMFTPEAQKGYQPLHAPIVVRDVVARDGLAFVLTDPKALGDLPVIDIFAAPEEGPLWRIGLRIQNGAIYGQLAVTEHGFWLFPITAGERVQWVDRVPDFVVHQSRAAAFGSAETAPPPPEESPVPNRP